MNYTVVFEGDTTPIVNETAQRLRELGYHSFFEDTATAELINSVNAFRRANSLTESDYIDPVTLRALGIDAEGDELIFAASTAANAAEDEVDCYDICCEIARQSKTLGLTLTEAASRFEVGGSYSYPPPSYALAAMVLALLNE